MAYTGELTGKSFGGSMFHSGGEYPQTFAVIGYGRVGKVLTRSFVQLGWRLNGVVDPLFDGSGEVSCKRISELPPETDLIVLAVPDGVIPSLLPEIADSPLKPAGSVVMHTAGAYGVAILAPLAECGFQTLAFHPFQTITGSEDMSLFSGVTFALDGSLSSTEFGARLACLLGGKSVLIPPSARGQYHLSAVFGSNLIIGALSVAVDLLARAGLPPEECLSVLLPLVRQTIQNCEQSGLPNALTGPVARGDAGTISSHLHTLADDPRRAEIYRLISLELLKLSQHNNSGSVIAKLLNGSHL